MKFEGHPVIGILRGFAESDVRNITAAAQGSGLRFLEITMNSPHAADLIHLATSQAGDTLAIGAGTVLNEEDLDVALAAGARFVVTPVANEVVIRKCVDTRIPVLPGAFTPTEIVQAWEFGATIVKVFPADQRGPIYIKRLKETLPGINLLPTGGVTLETLPDWLAAGADGFGVGSPLFDKDRVRAGDWTWVEKQCRAFIAAAGPQFLWI